MDKCESSFFSIMDAAVKLSLTRVCVLISSGKESVVLFDMMIRYCQEHAVVPVFLTKFLVPGLAIDEDVFRVLEERSGYKILRVPHPRRENMFDSDTLYIKNVFEAKPSRKQAHTKDFDDWCKKLTRAEWIADGIRVTDSVQRSLSLRKNPNPHPKLKKVHPLAEWKKKDIWDYIEERSLPISKMYFPGMLGRSLDCLNVSHCKPIRDKIPEDYAKIVEDFPLLDAIIHTCHGIFRCHYRIVEDLFPLLISVTMIGEYVPKPLFVRRIGQCTKRGSYWHRSVENNEV